MSWSQEAVAYLVREWAAGKSASEVSKGILRELKEHHSRNAVVGKVHRMGMCGRATPSRNIPAVRKHKPQRLEKPKAMPLFGDPNAPKETRTVKIDAKVSRALPPHPINQAGEFATLLTLTSRMCAYPIGDPKDSDFAFCGRTKSHGSYCKEHGSVCYVPVLKRRAA